MAKNPRCELPEQVVARLLDRDTADIDATGANGSLAHDGRVGRLWLHAQPVITKAGLRRDTGMPERDAATHVARSRGIVMGCRMTRKP